MMKSFYMFFHQVNKWPIIDNQLVKHVRKKREKIPFINYQRNIIFVLPIITMAIGKAINKLRAMVQPTVEYEQR